MASEPVTPDLDFNYHLPKGQMWFTVRQVAHYWGVSEQHVINLVNEGRFTHPNFGPVNLAGVPGKTRATARIPRASLVAFLETNMFSAPLVPAMYFGPNHETRLL